MIKRIKKHSNGNTYCLTHQDKWVRNFVQENVPYLDLNSTIRNEDHFVFLQNETINSYQKFPWIDSEPFLFPDVVIVSDGFGFEEKKEILEKLPKSVILIGVNGVLSKWKSKNRSLDFYLVNNPYQECLNYIPKNTRNFPRCFASCRTNFEFLNNYRGLVYRYYPVNESSYSSLGSSQVTWQVDDYRNPICAAISIAYRFGVEKLMLCCCDNSFEKSRPGAVQLENKLWTYPQHLIAHSLIEGNIFWLKKQPYWNVEIKDHSSGPTFQDAPYISEEEILSFFGVNNDE